MADYKRMVSYMYQYENGVKKKNVGFARVEIKGGQCKITLHMQLLGQLDSIFPTYFICREKNSLELIYIGDTMLKNQVMDSKLNAIEGNVMNSGYPVSKMGGILLFLNNNVFYATEWDDRPIVAKEVLEALKPKEKRMVPQMPEKVPTIERNIDKPNNNLQDERDEYQEENDEENNEDDGKKSKDDGEDYEEDENREEEDAKDLEEILDEIIEDFFPGDEARIQEEFTLEEDTAFGVPKYKLPRGYKMIERLCNPFDSEVEQHINHVMEAANMEANALASSEHEKQIEENIVTAEHEKQIEENMVSAEQSVANWKEHQEDELLKSVLNASNTDYAGDQQPDSPVAMQLLDKYTRIYPFEDNEILLCVKIEPKDIGLLPKEIWGLSSNSFLMHGYYCYHHLIFAKRKNRFGVEYILGVPGIYHNRERFMAKMFGFESFKSVKKRDLRQGDFGYWYITINL